MTAKKPILPWQQQPWDLLCSYIKQDRIPQALLIIGANGLGKHHLANQFAFSLLCSNRREDGLQCGHCQSCTLINAGTHPDFISITPEDDKTTIAISQIRQIVSETCLKPQFDSYRVIIINPADSMTVQAANAFLKCLEEPGERTLFLLITDKPGKLPATIISRCQSVSLAITDTTVLRDWLQSQGIAYDLATAINLVRSSVLSLQQIHDVALLKQRSDCFNDWFAIATHKKHPVIVSEKWQKLPKAALINWQISWLTDVIKCMYRINLIHICNQDVAIPIQALAQQLHLDQVFGLYDRLMRSRQQLDSQLNFQLMLEDILIQWQAVNGRP
jgi:DNA polymerase III subunit delta'